MRLPRIGGDRAASQLHAHETTLRHRATRHAQTARVFLPAPFDLVELDDAMLLDHHRSRRLLVHANGLVTEPAEQVLLGWVSPSSAQAVTATRRHAGRVSIQETGRADAIYVAGNHAPDGIGDPLLPLSEWAQLQATSGTNDARWHHADVSVDDEPIKAEAIDVALGSFGWLQHHDLIVAFALRHLPTQNLRLRTMNQGTATRYPCNPLAPRTWREFVDSNQALSSRP